ncbi:hypothetical protein LTS08_008139 [Lithohypha guttulata]|nr:hypothetical protein LTS08_008139 [Lithohypha guttulata]
MTTAHGRLTPPDSEEEDLIEDLHQLTNSTPDKTRHHETNYLEAKLTAYESVSRSTPDKMEDQEQHDMMKVTLHWQSEKLELGLETDATIYDLALVFADKISADVEKVSLLVTPKPGLLKHPFSDVKIHDLLTDRTRIKAIGTPIKDVQKLNDTAAQMAARKRAREAARREGRHTKSTPNRDWKKVQEEATYTFHAIEPLKYLPNPEKSRRYLERLANDPGIKASMRKHKFSVGLLTEMNPAEHTTHESKTLGLNRNAGEVIELRLRTDSYDGYRDYKVIRKTLCHELSHNVHGEHDRKFWDLTKQIEKEVESNDYLHGGHKLSQDEFYDPDDVYEDDHADGGGWKGGEFVLGGVADDRGLSRRDIMARAAMSRIQRQKEADEHQKQAEPGAPGSSFSE